VSAISIASAAGGRSASMHLRASSTHQPRLGRLTRQWNRSAAALSPLVVSRRRRRRGPATRHRRVCQVVVGLGVERGRSVSSVRQASADGTVRRALSRITFSPSCCMQAEVRRPADRLRAGFISPGGPCTCQSFRLRARCTHVANLWSVFNDDNDGLTYPKFKALHRLAASKQ
jgi:hypothetical protein